MKAGRSGMTRVVLALALSTSVAASAWAEALFYREVVKEGRLYVFAQGSRYEAFDKSGGAEIGTAITRPGYGPHGETVVFDTEDAINLYNFKHDLPGEVFAKPKENPKPKEDSFVRLGVTLFTDFTYTEAPPITDSDKNSVHKSEFEVRRAYLNVTGNISEWFSYRVTPDVAARLATTTTTAGLPAGSSATAATNYDGSDVFRLKYAFGQLNLDQPLRSKGSWVRFGQQQTPYVDFMEQIYRYRFQGTTYTEREGFQSSADVGLSGHYNFPGSYGDVHLGYYNGDTYTKAEANDQKSFQIRGSLRPFPRLDVLKGLRFHLFYNHDHPVRDASRQRFVLSTTFEHPRVNLGIDYLDATDQASARKPSVKADGWSVWVTPRTKFGLEALFRHDHTTPNSSVDAARTRTIAGIAYWFRDKMPLAAAVLADYEEVRYDPLLVKPTERRWELKAYFNF
jgi:phosphate-selective porin O/P